MTTTNTHKEHFKPSVSDTIEHGFRHTWKNIGPMVALSLIYILIYAVTVSLTTLGLGIPFIYAEGKDMELEFNIFFLVSASIMMIIMAVFMMSVYRGFIVTDKQEKVEFSKFFSLNKNIFMGFVTVIVSNIVMFIPVGIFIACNSFSDSGTTFTVSSIILAVVEILLAFYLSYAPFYSLEDAAGPFTAMKRSCEDVSKNPLYILGTIVMTFIIAVIGSFFVITILFVVPMSMVVSAHVYRNISRHRNDDAIESINKRYYPAAEPMDDGAMKDFGNVIKESNDQDKL